MIIYRKLREYQHAVFEATILACMLFDTVEDIEPASGETSIGAEPIFKRIFD